MADLAAIASGLFLLDASGTLPLFGAAAGPEGAAVGTVVAVPFSVIGGGLVAVGGGFLEGYHGPTLAQSAEDIGRFYNEGLPSGPASSAVAGSARPGFGGLSRAAEFGVRPYRELRGALGGTDLQAHHLIEQRFGGLFGTTRAEGLSVAVTRAEHQAFTNEWRRLIGYGPGTRAATRESVEAAAREVYRDYPEILRALGL